MNRFIDTAISRSRATLMLMAMVVLAGLFARATIPIANEPEIVLPYFYVGIAHEGISPEDSERLLLQPMEIELRKLEGIEEINSRASEGYATLFVEFDASYDLDMALLDLREAVDRGKAEIPTTAEEPIVRELEANDYPLIQINLMSNGANERQIYKLALDLRDDIESVPGVLSADLQGDREEVLEVLINPQALEAYGLTSESLVNTLQRNNRLIPAGSIDAAGGRFSVKVPSVVEDAADVLDLPISTSGDAVVTLSDVATIRRTFKDRTGHARFNGRETISLNVKMRTNGNAIDTVAGVMEVVDRTRERAPKSIDIVPSQNQAEFAEQQVTELQGNIITALALVMVLVVAAMGFRSGLIVGLGIPVSLLFSFIVLSLIGFTFNFMVMFGMLLGLGMLIDGAIVVTEYADRRMSEGMNHRAAYSDAVTRMFWPVTASTATTLAAFLPLMFWPGVPGQFMSYMPVTVFTVLVGSLVYALLFGPVLGTLLGRPSAHSEATRDSMERLEHGDPTQVGGFTGAYARLLTVICARPLMSFGLFASLLGVIFLAYSNFGRGMIFFNDADPQFVNISVNARGNFGAEEVDGLVREVEREVLQVVGIRSVNTQTSADGLNSGNGSSSDRVGSIFIEFMPESQRDRSGMDIVREVRERTQHMAGFQVEVQPMEQGPPVGKAIQIELRSRNRELLEPAMARIRNYIDEQPEFVDIDDTSALPSIEWRMKVDRAQAALYNADVVSAGVALQLVTGGVKIADYRPTGADDAVDIRARFPASERGINAMDSLRINTAQGRIPLSNFVTIAPAQGVDTFNRLNGLPMERIRADVVEGVLADDMVQRVKQWIAQEGFDPSIEIRFRGANEEQEASIAFVGVAFSMSLLLMFVLLVTQFNSFYQSGLILLAVVMSTAGVLLGLLITGSPFSAVLTGVGIVALAGIVVNNNIVLIDTYNFVRQQHPELPIPDAIVRASAQRMRPVLLTTVTTVFGLLPLACGLSVDIINRSITPGGQMSSFWGPLSQAIVFGLTFATILTLLATPALLALPSSLRTQHGFRFPQKSAEPATS